MLSSLVNEDTELAASGTAEQGLVGHSDKKVVDLCGVNMKEDETSQIEKLFYKDVRDKSITARGVHNRALRKKGFRGGVKFLTDYLKPSQVKKLNGEVKVYNMYDTIPAYEQFKNGFTLEQKVQMMNHWINDLKMTKEDIVKAWGFTEKQLHYYYDTVYRLKKHGLVITNATPSKRGGYHPRKKGVTPPEAQVSASQVPAIAPPAETVPVVTPESIRRPNIGFSINFNEDQGIGGEELAQRLLDIASIINKSKKYIIFGEIGELKEG